MLFRIMPLIFSVCVFSMSSSMANPPDYELPKEIDRNRLIKSSVIIRNEEAFGTGIAIGPKHILTAAHNLAAYALEKSRVNVHAFTNPEKKVHLVPTAPYYSDEDGNECFIPDFTQYPESKSLKVANIHFHPKTLFEKIDAKGTPQTVSGADGVQRLLDEVMQYGLTTVGPLSSYGVKTNYSRVDEHGFSSHRKARVSGPDLALIECSEPHGLPFLEIAQPLPSEKTVVHIVGLSGLRYLNDDSSKTCGGDLAVLDGRIFYRYMPNIYGQRFLCLKDEKDLFYLMNRVFLKKTTQGVFLMDDQVSPNPSKGFGLIAAADSGAGAIVVKDGKPYLAGIASSGDIESIFLTIHDAYLLANTKRAEAESQYGADCLSKLIKFYEEALRAEEREKKWFITQCLSDVTHLKDWIDGVMGKAQK